MFQRDCRDQRSFGWKFPLAIMLLAALFLASFAGPGLAQDQQEDSEDGSAAEKDEDGLASLAPLADPRDDAKEVVEGKYIVSLIEEADPQEEAEEAESDEGATIDKVMEETGAMVLDIQDQESLDSLRADEDVAFIEPDVIIPIDPPPSEPETDADPASEPKDKDKGKDKVKAEGKNKEKTGEETSDGVSFAASSLTGEYVPNGVNRIDAETEATFASGPAVAVIDSGIDTDNPELNVAGGANMRTFSGTNCAQANNGPGEDDYGHGTHVSGTIGAKGDGSGIVGVAPNVPIYALKVLDAQGNGQLSHVNCAIDWVAARASTIKVANMSLAGSGSDDPNCYLNRGIYLGTDSQHKSICKAVYAGVTFAVAAANANSNFANFRPAAYDEVLTVTAMSDTTGAPGGTTTQLQGCSHYDQEETSADFSNWTTASSADASHVIAAPGVCILSTWPTGGYAYWEGTSMASPHVAGTLVRCLAAGACSGDPRSNMATVLQDAADQPSSYGFTSEGGHNYGKLVYAGQY